MNRDRSKAIASWRKGWAGAALTAIALACPAQAQSPGSVSDYQLPPAPAPTPAPTAGPVDSENPAATPTAPTPRQVPAPAASAAASPAPRITLPAVTPQARPQPTAQRPQSAPSAQVPSPIATTATGALREPAAQPEPVIPAAPAAAPEVVEENAGSNLWLIFGALFVLALLIGSLLLMRRKPAVPEEIVEAIEAEAEAQTVADESPPVMLTPLAPQAPEKPAAKKPVPSPAFGISPLGFRFAPQVLRLSFVYATLSYRIELANDGDEAITGLRIGGDMISAHASLPNWQQLLLGEGLAPRHEVAALTPGEVVALTGELQLPLAEVMTVRAGAAQLLVPLARFFVEAGEGKLADTHIFSIGQTSGQPGSAMTPFRLDLGPQSFRQIDQREVDIARWLEADAQSMAS